MPSSPASSRCWVPLVYSSMAMLEHQGEQASLFPCHPWVVAAVLCELLLLDGTFDASTMTVQSHSHVSLRNVEDEESEELATTTCVPRYQWHMMSSASRTSCSLLDLSSSVVRETGGAAKHRKRKRGFQETSNIPADSNQNSSLTTELPTAQSVVSCLLDRVTAYATAQPLVFQYGSTSQTNDPPLRKVSDSDSDEGGRSADEGSVASSILTMEPASVGIRDIARYWKHPLGLVGRDESSSVPPFLEASIVTEEALRQRAHDMTRVLLETFETRHLRHFFGYRKAAGRLGVTGDASGGGAGLREGLIRLVKDYLFDASHALFAWQDFEITNCRTSPSNQGCSRQDEATATALFDHRALQRIGGMGSGSILRLSLALGRLQRSGNSWQSLFASEEGKLLLQHHAGKRNDLLRIGELRRGRRLRRRRSSGPNASPVECPIVDLPSRSIVSSYTSAGGSRSRASSIASLEEEDLLPSFDVSHGRLQVRISRQGPVWGVKLSKIGDMCVVERSVSFITSNSTSERQVDQLLQGDHVLLVANCRGDSAYSPAYKAQKQCPDWFRSMVNMFSSSSEVVVLVQRVASPPSNISSREMAS